MDTPLFKVLWTTLRTLFYSEMWFAWIMPVLTMIVVLYWLFVIFHQTSASDRLKIFMAVLFLPTALMLLNIPNFYENMRAGSPDKKCPELTINPLTSETEPVKYEYMWQYVVPGPAETGFADLFVRQYEIFGMSLNAQNSHLCRLPYDEQTKKLLANIKAARDAQGKAAKAAGVPAERVSEFGNIQITLPGSAESRAKMKSFLSKQGDKKRKGEQDRDDSFGNAEFKAPDKKTTTKTETNRSPEIPQ